MPKKKSTPRSRTKQGEIPRIHHRKDRNLAYILLGGTKKYLGHYDGVTISPEVEAERLRVWNESRVKRGLDPQVVDGTPVTEGKVIFETETTSMWGELQKDGSYTLFAGEYKGVPRGTYKVSLTGANDKVTQLPSGGVRIVPAKHPFDRKYLGPMTSGLVCEVNGRTVYDITLDPAK